jgi:hypothetical protein
MEGASLQEQHKLKKAEARQKPATSVQGATFQVEGVSNRDHIKDAATSKAIRMGDNNIVGWVLIMLVLLLIKAAKENKARNEMERVASQLSQGKGLNGDASLKDLRMEVTRDGGTGRLSCKFSQIKRDAKGKVVFDKDGVPEKEPVDAQDPRAKKAINMMCANLGLDSPVDGKPKAATTLAAATPAAATTSLSPVTAGVSPAAPMSGAASTAAAPESVVPGVGP